jgi:hypothetical protein
MEMEKVGAMGVVQELLKFAQTEGGWVTLASLV